MDVQKAEVLNNLFTSVFNGNPYLLSDGQQDRDWESQVPHVSED